jgi:hypothetical protein
MSLFTEQNAFTLDLARLIAQAAELGFQMSLREVQRTSDQQAIYVKMGRSQTMESNHLRSCAGDLYFMRDGVLVMDKASLQPLGDFWEALNPKNSWGGNWNSFKDLPHFERRP